MDATPEIQEACECISVFVYYECMHTKVYVGIRVRRVHGKAE